MIAFEDVPAQILAQFYLAQIYEKTERETEAEDAYGNFLQHFENSSAKLPRIPEAHAGLKRVLAPAANR